MLEVILINYLFHERTKNTKMSGGLKLCFFSQLGRQTLIFSVRYSTSGYRIVNNKIIKEFSEYYSQDHPEVEVVVDLAKKGYKINEIRVDMNARQDGISSITPINSIYYMIKVTYFSLVRKVF